MTEETKRNREKPARKPADLRHLAMANVAIAITLLALELKVLRLTAAESTLTVLTAGRVRAWLSYFAFVILTWCPE
jgi:uncharacterized membrane protein